MTTESPTAPANTFADPQLRRAVGVSFRSSYRRRVESGFMRRYFSGPAILDIGFRGGDPNAVPITETAIGVELDYPGYDGKTLPFPDSSQDTVLAAHVLEHIFDYKLILRDWMRVLKIGGFLVLMVPHRDLYERRPDLPSRWNGDHKRLYTPASLMREVEDSLPVHSCRVRHLVDNDFGFDYTRAPNLPPGGGFEIELVLQKIAAPAWAEGMRFAPETQQAMGQLDILIFEAIRANLAGEGAGTRLLACMIPSLGYFPPWVRVRQCFLAENEVALKNAVRSLLELVAFDVEAYIANCKDLLRAHGEGSLKDPRQHWLRLGYFEGRVSLSPPGGAGR